MVAGRTRKLGWNRDTHDVRDYRLTVTRRLILPKTTDLRALCPPVGNQGQVGSCVANASCEAMEFLERRGAKDTLYSRLYLYARTRQFEGTSLSEDSGSQIRDAVRILAADGVCLEATWPYDPPEQRFMLDPTPNCDEEAAQHKALMYYRCVDLYTIKMSLHQGFPVIYGFDVPSSMDSDAVAQSGLLPFDPSESSIGGHAVLAVGYDDSKVIGSSTGALLTQNSWGEDWGQGGFFYLPYDFFTHGKASDFWTLRRAAV
jgi:C1A family cysteine protease